MKTMGRGDRSLRRSRVDRSTLRVDRCTETIHLLDCGIGGQETMSCLAPAVMESISYK